MPTPFYHLSLAEELLSHPGLADAVRQFLETFYGEFLFGNTAPDVQVVSGQAREATHFFSLPIQVNDHPAWKCMLSEHPHLAGAGKLDAAQAAFLAGYLCHLQADWNWVMDIFAPKFGPDCTWGTFSQRLYYHNVLRSYLDLHIVDNLPAGIDTCLSQVAPANWLPFVQDRHLVDWRNFLTPQLEPGGTIQTVEVFSSRQGICAPEYYALLQSEERMEQEIFTQLPLAGVKEYNLKVLDENISFLNEYLVFTLHPTPVPIDRRVFRGAQR